MEMGVTPENPALGAGAGGEKGEEEGEEKGEEEESHDDDDPGHACSTSRWARHRTLALI
jgi:hypothetical protein